MAHFPNKYILIAATGFIFTCCTKNNNNTTGTGGTGGKLPDSTVYVSGDNGSNPILWQNGVPDTLSATLGTARQVIVSGSDVYVAGICQEIINYYSPGVLDGPIRGQYAYWKNGVQNNVDSFQDIVYNNVSIAVVGNNVYYANGQAWENGAIIPLTGLGNGVVASAFADGSDIYFVGTDSAQDAVYWKNGQLNIVSAYQGRGSTLPHPDCIYVSGTDVYAGGMFNQAVYWKNGVANFLVYTGTAFVPSVSSIFVSGNDVYTTGNLIGANNVTASYWKNGVENDLTLNSSPNPPTSYFTNSFFLSGSDIYVAGYSYTQPPVPTMVGTYAPVFWKNGVETVLAPAGYAYSVYVH